MACTPPSGSRPTSPNLDKADECLLTMKKAVVKLKQSPEKLADSRLVSVSPASSEAGSFASAARKDQDELLPDFGSPENSTRRTHPPQTPDLLSPIGAEIEGKDSASFAVFKDDHREDMHELHPGSLESDIDDLLSVAWDNLSSEDKAEYKDRAEEEARQHKKVQQPTKEQDPWPSPLIPLSGAKKSDSDAKESVRSAVAEEIEEEETAKPGSKKQKTVKAVAFVTPQTGGEAEDAAAAGLPNAMAGPPTSQQLENGDVVLETEDAVFKFERFVNTKRKASRICYRVLIPEEWKDRVFDRRDQLKKFLDKRGIDSAECLKDFFKPAAAGANQTAASSSPPHETAAQIAGEAAILLQSGCASAREMTRFRGKLQYHVQRRSSVFEIDSKSVKENMKEIHAFIGTSPKGDSEALDVTKPLQEPLQDELRYWAASLTLFADSASLSTEQKPGAVERNTRLRASVASPKTELRKRIQEADDALVEELKKQELKLAGMTNSKRKLEQELADLESECSTTKKHRADPPTR